MIATAIATFILALIAVVAAIIALRQQREMANERQAELLQFIYKELDTRREERRIVFNQLVNYNENSFSRIPPEVRHAADNVAASMQYIGQLVANRLIRKGLVLEMCCEAVINSWEAMKPYVSYRR